MMVSRYAAKSLALPIAAMARKGHSDQCLAINLLAQLEDGRLQAA